MAINLDLPNQINQKASEMPNYILNEFYRVHFWNRRKKNDGILGVLKLMYIVFIIISIPISFFGVHAHGTVLGR